MTTPKRSTYQQPEQNVTDFGQLFLITILTAAAVVIGATIVAVFL